MNLIRALHHFLFAFVVLFAVSSGGSSAHNFSGPV